MSSSLDRHVKEYYESTQLPPEAIERLRQLVANSRTPRTPVLTRWLAVAAVVALITLSIAIPLRRHAVANRLSERIAREAALIYSQHLGVEVAATDYRALRVRMKNLRFAPAESASLAPMRMRLIGGRYMSLAGRPAVQLELIDAKGEPCTLIQTTAEGVQIADRQTQYQIDGLLVDVWKEKGLVMVLARPA